MILDWKTGYANDPDTSILFKAIRSSDGKALLPVIINLVAMDY